LDNEVETAIAKIGTGIYTAADAAKILRIPYSKSKYWFNYYAKNKLLKSIGYQYYFEFNDTIAIDFLTLIEMYVFYVLKDEIHMKTNNIIKYHKILSGELNTNYPFANCDIYAAKKSIVFESNAVYKNADDLQQTFITDFLIPFYKKITFNDERVAHKYHPLGKEKSVIIDPEHQFGKPIIDGTNIVTETLYDYYLGGDEIEFIARLYNITPENVKDAIAFFEAA
jgi:uncharacterized protein (DUF433 family)